MSGTTNKQTDKHKKQQKQKQKQKQKTNKKKKKKNTHKKKQTINIKEYIHHHILVLPRFELVCALNVVDDPTAQIISIVVELVTSLKS